DERHTRAARQWRDPNPSVPILAPSAGLLLVLSLPFVFATERFAVRHLGFRGLRVDAELPCEPTHDDLEVALAQAADQRLSQLPVVLVMESRVLFVELVQSGRELVLLAALLHFHGHR